MLKRRKESKAFWIFLVWVLFLPFLLNSNLAAQDENVDDFVVSDEPLPDEAPKASGKASEEAAGEPADADSAEPADKAAGDEEPLADDAPANEELPALSADPNELLSKVNGSFRAKKYDEVVKELADFEDAVGSLKELSEIYVESLINSKKPDWNTVNSAAKALQRLDKKGSLADYAQGLYYQNKSKPDLAKAITFFSKAKSANKPFPGAANAYYMAMLKKFWMILAGVILLPIVIIANKIKKKKAASAAVVEINLDGLEAAAGENLQNDLQAAISGDSASVAPETTPAPEAKKTATEPVAKPPIPPVSEAKEPAKALPPKPEPVSQTPPPVQQQPQQPQPQVVPAQADQPPVIPPAVSQPHPASAQPVGYPHNAPPPQPAGYPHNAPSVQPAQYSAPADASHSYDSLSAKRAAEIEHARSLISPARRDPVSADPELDALWSNLCRKALQGKISPHSRSSYDSDSGPRFSNFKNANYEIPEPVEPSFDLNVTIDLSEESLKDDLIGKLKMLAISDGELRTLLGQKNPKHIPHLIEYVLSRPEPVRLALVTRELGHYNDPAIIDTLASLLYNEDHRVALAAIQGLENSKNSIAILHICPFLKSEIPLLAQAARTALSNFGAVKILKAFVRLPQHPDAKIREAGVFVLSRMKGAQVEQLLVQMLNDDSQEIREKVILAMSYQKNPGYIDPLREFFRIAVGPDKALARKGIVYLQGFATKKK